MSDESQRQAFKAFTLPVRSCYGGEVLNRPRSLTEPHAQEAEVAKKLCWVHLFGRLHARRVEELPSRVEGPVPPPEERKAGDSGGEGHV